MGFQGSLYSRYNAFSPSRIIRRELGFGHQIGAGDVMAKSLYCSMKPIASWEATESGCQPHGGVFNMEFSPDGSMLVAACEKKTILIFDPLTNTKTHTVPDAHSDCVNCVKFLDGRMFATCSDDTTIALWDVRNLKKKIRSLLGHSNWVKNIEYSVKDNLLVTSGLDGSIYTWDINSYIEWSLVYQRVFHASGLMRCRISADASQMVMCTTGGLLIIVHDLNLARLAADLQGFKPNLYRLMQMSKQVIPLADEYDHLFHHKRKENRVEFISDFPDGNDAEVVSSLQIHPQGWCALSRNISHNDRSEWTCLHDIQACPEWRSGRDESPPPEPGPGPGARGARGGRGGSARGRRPAPRATPLRQNPHRPARPTPSYPRDSGGGSEPQPGPSTSRQSPSSSRVTGGGGLGIQNDVWEASITIKQHRALQEMASRGQVGRNFNMQRIMGINTGISPPAPAPAPAPAPPTAPAPPAPPSPPTTRSRRARQNAAPLSILESVGARRPVVTDEGGGPGGPGGGGGGGPGGRAAAAIRQNKDRLLYYIEETNEGRGFIKELCFSADGRLICSPFGYGMRLLALSDSCAELPQCVQSQAAAAHRPRALTELGQIVMHQDLVVSSKFSPRHPLLVTGCLAGKVVWYAPHTR